MTKLNPEHGRYPGTDIEIDYTDVVTRGKATTLWEVVDTEYPNKVRLSRIGSYGETNAWTTTDQLHFCHRTRFAGHATCQGLLDKQAAIRENAAHVREKAQYVRRIDDLTVATAEAIGRQTARLHRAVAAHRRVLADVYGIHTEAKA